jgi:hypothetical protein
MAGSSVGRLRRHLHAVYVIEAHNACHCNISFHDMSFLALSVLIK